MKRTSHKDIHVIKLRLADEDEANNETVTDVETFEELKYRVLTSMAPIAASPEDLIGIFAYYTVKLQGSSSVRKTVYVTPSPFDRIVNAVRQLELTWPGEVTVVLVDIRTNSLFSTYSLLNESFDTDESTLGFKPTHCTEWITRALPTDPQITGIKTIAEFMFWEISNSAIKQGKLMKKMVASTTADTWKEEYFMLCPNRLWYFSTKAWDSDKHLSFVELSDNTKVNLTYPNSPIFTLNFSTSARHGPMVLKAKSGEEAETWVNALCSREIDEQGNDIFANIEMGAEAAEFEEAVKDIDELNLLCSFEGLLACEDLRERFRNHLYREMVTEKMLFWERAEDYRRGHPQSKQPLGSSPESPYGDEQSGMSPAEFTKRWAENIYYDFLAPHAPRAYPHSEEMAVRIKEKIVHMDCPAADVFDEIQVCAFEELKRELYPKFTNQKNYKKILAGAVYRMKYLDYSGRTSRVRDGSLDVGSIAEDVESTASDAGGTEATQSVTSSSPKSKPAASGGGGGGKNMFGALMTMGKFVKRLESKAEEKRKNKAILTHPNGKSAENDRFIVPWRTHRVQDEKHYWLPESWWHNSYTKDRDLAKAAYNPDVTWSLARHVEKNVSELQLESTWRPWHTNTVQEIRKLLGDLSKESAERLEEEERLKQLFQMNFKALKIVDDTADESMLRGPERVAMARRQTAAANSKRFASYVQPHQANLGFGIHGMVVLSGPARCSYHQKNNASSTPFFQSHSGPGAPTGYDRGTVYMGAGQEDIYDMNGSHSSFSHHAPGTDGHSAQSHNQTHNTVSFAEPPSTRQSNTHSVSFTESMRMSHATRRQTMGLRASRMSAFGGGADASRTTTSSVNRNISLASIGETEAENENNDQTEETLAATAQNALIEAFGLDMVRYYIVFVEVLGIGKLLLYDYHSHVLLSQIDLSSIVDISVDHKTLNGINLKDLGGLAWKICPESVEEEDAKFTWSRWVNLIIGYVPNPARAAGIVHVGYLWKRGQINTSFKRRWFVLTTDRKLLYYKDCVTGGFKGEINLRRVSNVYRGNEFEESKGSSLPGSSSQGSSSMVNWLKSTASGDNSKANLQKQIGLWTHSKEKGARGQENMWKQNGRLYIVRAETLEDFEVWFSALKTFVMPANSHQFAGEYEEEEVFYDDDEESDGEGDGED